MLHMEVVTLVDRVQPVRRLLQIPRLAQVVRAAVEMGAILAHVQTVVQVVAADMAVAVAVVLTLRAVVVVAVAVAVVVWLLAVAPCKAWATTRYPQTVVIANVIAPVMVALAVRMLQAQRTGTMVV